MAPVPSNPIDSLAKLVKELRWLVKESLQNPIGAVKVIGMTGIILIPILALVISMLLKSAFESIVIGAVAMSIVVVLAVVAFVKIDRRLLRHRHFELVVS